MVLPRKHIKLSESLIGVAAFILDQNLNNPISIDDLWDELRVYMQDGRFPRMHSIDDLVLAIDILYALGFVDGDLQGKVKLCDSYR